jgi:hypothetical protein
MLDAALLRPLLRDPRRHAAALGLLSRFGLPMSAVAVTLFVAIVVQGCFADNYPYDLAYLHAAGEAWRAGADPYGPAYAKFAAPYVPSDAAIWAYPPQWWVLVVPLSVLPIHQAAIIWKLVNLTALALGAALLCEAVAPKDRKLPLATTLIFAAVFASADAVRISLHLGQTSLLIALGFALVLHGARNGGAGRQALGLALLMLKPQLGLFCFLLMVCTPKGRVPALAALACTALACVPLLADFGLAGALESARGFLRNMAVYGSLLWNRPGELTGVSYLSALAGTGAPPPLLLVLAGWLGTEFLTQRGDVGAHRRWLVGLAVLFATAPLHPYDMALLPASILLLPDLKPWARGLVCAAVAGIWHTSTIAFTWLGGQPSSWMPGIFEASLIQSGAATFAGLAVFAALAFGWTDRKSLAA